ncbi:PIG-L family deacetylase [Croceicoccus sp. F390]|uniref:PIG-L family deacetylase n=1 Tax=Croceicoccus esteveae TaxID=3075597 RepID=A0ABU2ZH38_9SPHN|nr:PIG-L family deacetylase [Croceicoccus sp. F390]MDT0575918.1 PIG-L family deacetylase [Croceicoccus sp. F390]
MTVPQHAAGRLLDEARDAPLASLDLLSPGRGLLLIIPHPDDEALGCGMALAAAAAAGRSIAIVLLTDGEGSHPCSSEFPSDRLRAVRQEELASSLTILTGGNPVPVHRLQLPDGRASAAMVSDAQLAALAALAGHIRASSIWTSWRGDPHCDHLAAAELGQRLAAKLVLPLWSFAVWGRFGDAGAGGAQVVRFVSAAHQHLKALAIAAHRTQMTQLVADDPTGFIMPGKLIEHFAGSAEIFLHDRA